MRIVAAMLTLLAATPAFAADKPLHVVTSIAPLGGIAAAVMEGAGTPDVMLKANDSPHTHELSPMDAAYLMEADVVLWGGASLEGFLARPLANLPRNHDATVLELGALDGLTHLMARSGGMWEADADEPHVAGLNDPHLWLDPDNATKIATILANVLAKKDEKHADLYRANAAKFAAVVKAQDAVIAAELASVKTKPYVVFHDAFQYFEKHYGLSGVGAVTLSPEESPSAARVAEIRSRITAQQVACVFAEPQFTPDILKTITAGTTVKTGTLNPDASDLPVDAALYPAWLKRVADSFVECLGR